MVLTFRGLCGSLSVYIVAVSPRRRAPPETNSTDECYKIALHVHLCTDMSPCDLVANPSQNRIGWLRTDDRTAVNDIKCGITILDVIWKYSMLGNLCNCPIKCNV